MSRAANRVDTDPAPQAAPAEGPAETRGRGAGEARVGRPLNIIGQVMGLARKDVRQWARDRQALVGPMLVPLVLMLICTVLFGYGGDEWNVALVNEGTGAASRQFAGAIERSRGNISPYYRIITREPEEARQLVDEGRLQMAIYIPADFDARLERGETPVLRTRVFNINTDMTKNVRLRLDHAIQDFLVARNSAPVRIEQFTTREEDVWRRAFIAGGALIVALLVGAALNTAIMVAREWERGTVKELVLAPGGRAAVSIGKLIAGLVATASNVAVTLVVAVALFGLRIPADRWLPLLGMGVLAALAAGGLGLAAGSWLKDYRTLQPLLLVTGAGSFFASGGYGSVATLPPAVRAFDLFWPPAYVFESMQFTMHSAQLPELAGTLMWLTPAALACLALGAATLRKALG